MESYLEMEFSRSELIEKLKQNREAHKAEFAEAMKGYYLEVVEEAEKLIDSLTDVKNLAERGELPESEAMPGQKVDFDKNFYLRAQKPISYETDYDRAITMLEMSKSDMIDLGEEGFARYVMDEWEWKDSFSATNSLYLSKTR